MLEIDAHYRTCHEMLELQLYKTRTVLSLRSRLITFACTTTLCVFVMRLLPSGLHANK